MRILLLYILFALLSQQTLFFESENLKTSESGKGSEQRAMSHEQRFRKAQSSQHEAQSPSQVFSFSDSQILYYESQIRLADSLYKNYLPQYNFDEVKKAVAFFDSLRLTTDNSQQTTVFLESENLEISESEKGCEQRAMSNEPFSETEKSVNISEICGNEKTNHKLVQKKSKKVCEPRAMSNEPFLESENLKTSESEKRLKSQGRNAQSSQHEAQSLKKTVDRCPLSVDIEYQRARAHYYHAVGLTERDDIVGACEHYFIALEIMEPHVETSPLWRLMTKDKGLMANGERLKSQVKENAHSSKLEAQSPDYEKIRFLSLIYTRLGELFLSENYCDLAISKYRKALKYVLLLGENIAVANTYKCLGNSYQLYNMPDSALYYYNKSLETNSELPNRLDVEKCIAQILFNKGERDSAFVMIRNNLDLIEDYIPKYAYYATLGDMFYGDMKYDSAIYFLGKSVLSNDVYTKYMSSTELSAIYDSLDNQEMMSYYDSMASELSNSIINSSVDKNSLLTVYNAYKERMHEKEMLRKQRKIKQFYVILASVLILSVVAIVLIRYRDKRKEKEISEAYSESKKTLRTKKRK